MDKNKILQKVANGLGAISDKVESLEKKITTKLESEGTVLQSNNKFDNYIKYKVVNGEKVESFSKNNIGLLLDKDTREITWCIYATALKGIVKECYKLETGELVLYNGITIKAYDGEFKQLALNSYKFNMLDINNYLSDITLKDSYTIDELKELEPSLKKSILIMNESKPKRRVYKK